MEINEHAGMGWSQSLCQVQRVAMEMPWCSLLAQDCRCSCMSELILFHRQQVSSMSTLWEGRRIITTPSHKSSHPPQEMLLRLLRWA